MRLTALAVVLLALAPAMPVGCPSSQTPTDQGTPTERGHLATTAEAPPSAATGETVSLRASVTTVADGGTVYYSWLQIAGAGVQIAKSDQAEASFMAPSLATAEALRFVVTTSNDAGDVGRADVSVQVEANPDYAANQGGGNGTGALGPVAAAGEDQAVSGGATVTLDGSGSSGLALKYHWRQVSGTTVALSGADGARATFAAPDFSATGTNVMEFELAVTDANNRTVTDRVRVRVRDPNGTATPRVRVTTTMGSFVIELNPDKAPITVQNFLNYVDQGFYTDTLFHRVIPDFVVQGGGYLAGLTEKPTGAPIVNESDNGLKNVRGSVAMARKTNPDSATAQFYVNLAANDFLDYQPGNPGYAVFGQVIEGMSVVDQISAVPTTTQGQFENVPVTDVVIQSVTRVQ